LKRATQIKNGLFEKIILTWWSDVMWWKIQNQMLTKYAD